MNLPRPWNSRRVSLSGCGRVTVVVSVHRLGPGTDRALKLVTEWRHSGFHLGLCDKDGDILPLLQLWTE